MEQWSAIEQALFVGGEHSGGQDSTPSILDQTDTFLKSIETFHQSEMFRIYNLIVPSPKTNQPFPSENIIGMVQDFRNSVIADDREKAAVLSARINGALVLWLTLDEKVARYYDAAFIRLILAFVFVIALTSAAVFIMSKAFARSIDRKAETTAFTQAVLLAKEE